MVDHYYTEDVTAVPYRVLREMLEQQLPVPVACALAGLLRLRGKLRWPLAATHGVAFLKGETGVARDALPPEAIAKWAVLEEPLRDLGFRPLRFLCVETIGATRKAYALWLDAANSTLGSLAWTATMTNGREKHKVNLEFNSYADSDPEYITGAAAEADLPASGTIALDFVDLVMLDERLDIAEIYASHLARIDCESVYTMTDERAVAVHAERSTRRMRRLLEQGILRELTESEVARLRRASIRSRAEVIRSR